MAAWALTLGVGFAALQRYEVTAGAPARSNDVFQAKLIPGRPNLVLFAHPQCPCSRATLAELEKILTAYRGELATTVWFYAPESQPAEWVKARLWQRANAIPGVRVEADANGRQAQLAGAETSGQVFLFDAHGKLLFSGGITSARGHEGDNAGRQAVLDRLNGRVLTRSVTPVFGCSLLGDDSAAPTS